MLRDLNVKDAPRMLEWMHDENVLKGLQPEKFRSKTLEDCIHFIESSGDKQTNCHMAVVDEQDQYLGTVSLKMIDPEYKDAEFSIVLRSDAHGRGYALRAMKDIIRIGFERYGLEEIYWNVLKRNTTAIKLYEKGGFEQMTAVSKRRADRAPKEVIFYHIRKMG